MNFLYITGHESVFHTGSWLAYSTIASLYPKAKSGFFMIVNGPWPIKFRTHLEPLSYVLADILLHEDQWLNLSTVCSFPEPWEKKQITSKTETKISTEEYDFTPCLGNYGHAIFGDVVIGNALTNGNLSIQMNSIAKGSLTLAHSENSSFHLNFAGKFSMFNDENCEARFYEKSDGLFQKLYIKCEGKYDFRRGVSFHAVDVPTSSATFVIINIPLLVLSVFILIPPVLLS
jgi:hypothetical protein